MSAEDWLKLLEYFKSNFSSPKLNKVYIALVLIPIFLYFLEWVNSLYVKYIEPRLDKEVQVEITTKTGIEDISSKFHLKLDEYLCNKKTETKNIFVCTVPKRDKYTCLLEYDGGSPIKEEVIENKEEYHKLVIDKTPLIIKDCDYYFDKSNNIVGNFKLVNPIKDTMARLNESLYITLCDGVQMTVKKTDGIINFHVPWKQLNHYYYESCKEGLEFSITQDGLTSKDTKIMKKFFFIGDTLYFNAVDQNFIKMDNQQLSFIGGVKQNNIVLFKDSENSFLFKLKATDFTSKTAIIIQIDAHTITIQGNSIRFDDKINMLEQDISTEPILEVEVRRDKKDLWIDIFQNGQKISGANNRMILSSKKIEKLKIGHYYLGELNNKAVLSIYDVSIQKWVPVNSPDVDKP